MDEMSDTNDSNDSMVALSIDPKAVTPIIEKKIQSAIIAALGDGDEIIGKMVTLALNKKVDSRGEVNSSSYYNTYDFMELLAEKAIRKAAEEALRDWLKENAEKVKTVVLKEIRKPSRQNSIAKALADGLEGAIKYNAINFNVTLDGNK